jgi:hypothetical protein
MIPFACHGEGSFNEEQGSNNFFCTELIKGIISRHETHKPEHFCSLQHRPHYTLRASMARSTSLGSLRNALGADDGLGINVDE